MILLLTLLLKSLLIFALAGAALLALRRASASARHLVCLLTLISLLALPLFSVTLPGWHLPMLAQGHSEPAPQEFIPTQAAVSVPEFPPAPNNGGVRVAPIRALLSAPSSPTPAPPLLGAGGNSFPWPLLCLTGYLLGVLLASLRPLLGLWGISRLRRACVPTADTPTLALSAQCAAALRLSRLPQLCRADVGVPMTWGGQRPVVLLPSASAEWREDRTQAVLLHEMAHVKRRDWTCHRLADFVCALYWFHPFVWLTARRLRAESELACDDLVLSTGLPAPAYARHLLDIAQALPSASRPTHSAIAMAQTSHIEGRITMILDKTQSRRALTRRALLFVLVPSSAALLTLAALRPGVKAQTAPTPSADAPNSSTHLNFQFKRMTSNKRADGQWSIDTDPDLTINGTTLFAGVTDADKPGGPWWSASGALLPTPVYDTNAFHAETHIGTAGTHNIRFAFRLPANAQGITTEYRLPQSNVFSSDGEWPGKTQSDALQTEAQRFNQTGGTRIITAAFPPTLKKASVHVGIASGAWKTAASAKINTHIEDDMISPGFSGNQGNQGFIISPALKTPKGLVLTVTTNSTDDLRVVAVDVQGNELLPADNSGSSIISSSINGMNQITVHFSQPISQIKEFRVETRPFHWIEFKNVALKPLK